MTTERTTTEENIQTRYWGKAHAQPFDATFITADVLAQKELLVILSEPGFNIKGEELNEHSTDIVHIYADDEAESIFDTIEAIHEYDVLKKISHTLGETFDKLVDKCNWDEATKKKVKAFNVQLYANYFLEQAERVNKLVDQHRVVGADSIRISYIYSIEQRYRTANLESLGQVKNLLGDMQPLSREDFRELLINIIDEVIQNPKTSRAIKTLGVRQVTRRLVRGKVKLSA